MHYNSQALKLINILEKGVVADINFWENQRILYSVDESQRQRIIT